MKRLTEDRKRELRAILKAAYDAVSTEPVPQSMHDLTRKLQ
jgi:hypothetical protein